MRRRTKASNDQEINEFRINLTSTAKLSNELSNQPGLGDENFNLISQSLQQPEDSGLFKTNRNRYSSIGTRTGVLRGIRTKESLLGEPAILQNSPRMSSKPIQTDNLCASNGSETTKSSEPAPIHTSNAETTVIKSYTQFDCSDTIEKEPISSPHSSEFHIVTNAKQNRNIHVPPTSFESPIQEEDSYINTYSSQTNIVQNDVRFEPSDTSQPKPFASHQASEVHISTNAQENGNTCVSDVVEPPIQDDPARFNTHSDEDSVGEDDISFKPSDTPLSEPADVSLLASEFQIPSKAPQNDHPTQYSSYLTNKLAETLKQAELNNQDDILLSKKTLVKDQSDTNFLVTMEDSSEVKETKTERMNDSSSNTSISIEKKLDRFSSSYHEQKSSQSFTNSPVSHDSLILEDSYSEKQTITHEETHGETHEDTQQSSIIHDESMTKTDAETEVSTANHKRVDIPDTFTTDIVTTQLNIESKEELEKEKLEDLVESMSNINMNSYITTSHNTQKNIVSTVEINDPVSKAQDYTNNNYNPLPSLTSLATEYSSSTNPSPKNGNKISSTDPIKSKKLPSNTPTYNESNNMMSKESTQPMGGYDSYHIGPSTQLDQRPIIFSEDPLNSYKHNGASTLIQQPSAQSVAHIPASNYSNMGDPNKATVVRYPNETNTPISHLNKTSCLNFYPTQQPTERYLSHGQDSLTSNDSNKMYSPDYSIAYAMWQQEYARWYRQVLEYQNSEYYSRANLSCSEFYQENNINDSQSFVSRTSVFTDRNDHIFRRKETIDLTEEPNQSIPYLYTNYHPRCTFGPCNKIIICNLWDNSINFFSTSFHNIPADENFPGPLTCTDTCARLISTYIQAVLKNTKNEEMKLLWHLLLLLTKNKKCDIKDVCDLLLNVNTNFKPSYSLLNTTPGLPASVHTMISESLIRDDLKTAIYHSVSHHNWGLAFSLAIKDNELTSLVLSKFLNTLDFHDVIYSHVSLQHSQPFRISSINVNDIITNWNQYVCLLLSARDYPFDECIKDIISISDILLSNGKWCEYQICKIILENSLNSSNSSNSSDFKNQNILIGNENQTFIDFTNINFIQLRMSEIYEQILLSNNSCILFPSLQEYKFLYAQLLYQFMNIEKSWEYISAISKIVVSNPINTFPHGFLIELKHMALRLFHIINASPSFYHHYPEFLIELCKLLQHPLRNTSSKDLKLQKDTKMKDSTKCSESSPLPTSNILMEPNKTSVNVVKSDVKWQETTQKKAETPQREAAFSPGTITTAPCSQSTPPMIEPQNIQKGVTKASIREEEEEEESAPIPLVTVTHHNAIMFSSVPTLVTNEGRKTESMRSTQNNHNTPASPTSPASPLTQQHITPANKSSFPSQSVSEPIHTTLPTLKPIVSSESDVTTSSSKPIGSNVSSSFESAEQQKGLLSGASNILKKFFKPKEQAFLPDDTNPTIIFDEKSKRYIDTSIKKDDSNVSSHVNLPPKTIPVFSSNHPHDDTFKLPNDSVLKAKTAARYIAPKY